ncbi:MAG: methyltransferase domain-containing protein [Chloroflexi bacterium]|jgi:2-polyprenyl-3-methyl-5-hydroxy-6-metoxy-1,4-benzoquinol methylase|nr:methyltransferase domain-containing protein [Chloroflexota bacterium]MBT3670056.1 methyltransferase domain-containing protein [Chloroflexota bacterium]MBT4002207.1 methyltransferase domain-containing protein [Chloroflexota bacterium]MBT4306742.1 methyltransferase domain-containing protein [Chloroflexota bacterium]MBT4532942.1 methyltransferase domain-containing protein [Chloroflexota bacterium]
METTKNCLLCKHEESSLFDKREMHGLEVNNRICKNCGFVYLSPRMTEEELDQFYKNEYRTLYHGQEAPTPADLNTQQQRADHLLSLVKNENQNITRHLDIGSSSGVLLKTIIKGFNCIGIGVEPGDSYRDYAESQGLKIYASLEQLKKDEKEKFDLISMSHVLEHMPDPIALLSELSGLLTEEGKLLVEVPNLYGHTSFEISHLSSFSPHTLAEIFKQAGYKDLKIKVHGTPRSKILPLYLTLLASPNNEAEKQEIIPERFVPAKRKLGMLNQKIMGRLFPKKAWLPKI